MGKGPITESFVCGNSMTPGQMPLYPTDFQGRKAARLMRVRGMTRPLLALWIWLTAVLAPALAPVLAAAPLPAAESGWVGDTTIGEARLLSAVAGALDMACCRPCTRSGGSTVAGGRLRMGR